MPRQGIRRLFHWRVKLAAERPGVVVSRYVPCVRKISVVADVAQGMGSKRHAAVDLCAKITGNCAFKEIVAVPPNCSQCRLMPSASSHGMWLAATQRPGACQ